MKQETTACRSCGARIRWVFTDKGHRMPLDPEPDPTGNIVIREDGDAHVITKDDVIPPQAERWISHFATCPEAARHRRRKH